MLFLMALLGCGTQKSPEGQEAATGLPSSASLADSLARVMEPYAARGFLGSVLVAQGDSVVFHQAYGAMENGEPVTVDTQLHLASISKQFTAVAILKMGIDLNAPLAESLPGDSPGQHRDITIHHLLSHRSGLGQNYAADDVPDRDEAVRRILNTALLSQPGDEFHYSNDGYALLAAVVDHQWGGFEASMTDRLFLPLGMTHTGFWGFESSQDRIAPLPGFQGERRPNWGFRGATGVRSTTGDLHRWCRALMAGEVLPPERRDLLWAPVSPFGSTATYGYGWMLSETPRGTRRIWTRGTEDYGANALIEYYPDEGNVTLIALSHSGDFDGTPVTRLVVRDFEEAVFGK